MPSAQGYSVVFNFRDIIAGRGWLAQVDLRGRAFVAHEDGLWFFYGAEPGGISQDGQNPGEAWFKFTASLRDLMVALAEDASDYEAFHKELALWAEQTDAHDLKRWEGARLAMREGKLIPEEPFSGLKKLVGGTEANLKVTLLGSSGDRLPEISPNANSESDYAAAA